MWFLRRLSQDAPSANYDGTAERSSNDPVVSRSTHNHNRRNSSPFRLPPLDPIVLLGYKSSTPQSARLLSEALATELRIMIPERLKLSERWRLVYSLEQDGASLATLYHKARQYEGQRVGFVLVVRDSDGGTFGGYLNEYPRPSSSYYGNGECFLWCASILSALPPRPSAETTHLSRSTTLPAVPTYSNNNNTSLNPTSTTAEPFSLRFKAFPFSGENDYCINCESSFLSLGAGAGGHYGLWLDSSLERGHSQPCDTFGNETLSDEGEKFTVLGLELWVIGA